MTIPKESTNLLRDLNVTTLSSGLTPIVVHHPVVLRRRDMAKFLEIATKKDVIAGLLSVIKRRWSLKILVTRIRLGGFISKVSYTL